VPGRPVKLILVARRGHAARLLPADHPGEDDPAGLDAEGNLVALHARIAGQSILGLGGALAHGERCRQRSPSRAGFEDEFGYMAVPNLLIDHGVRNTHVPVGFWRGRQPQTRNAIYMECFIDELAAAAGKDPARVPAQAPGEEPQASRGAERRVREGRLRQEACPRACSAASARTWGFGSYTRGRWPEVSVSDKGKVTIHRIGPPRPTRATRSIPEQIARQVEGLVRLRA